MIQMDPSTTRADTMCKSFQGNHVSLALGIVQLGLLVIAIQLWVALFLSKNLF